jgi:plastocyanin
MLVITGPADRGFLVYAWFSGKEWKMETTQQVSVRGFQWRTLVQLAALANLAVLLFMGVGQQDQLALVLSGLTVVGLALTRLRGGLAGALLSGVLFADISFWTISGAVNNFIYREQGLALLLPSFLGIISLTGLLACMGAVVTRRRVLEASRVAPVLGAAALVLLGLAAAASLFFGTASARQKQESELALGSSNMVYSSSELTARPGEITLSLGNEDLWWHTFTIDELDVDLQVPMRADRSVTFTAPAGVYRFYCAIPGHEALGMHGTLRVEE